MPPTKQPNDEGLKRADPDDKFAKPPEQPAAHAHLGSTTELAIKEAPQPLSRDEAATKIQNAQRCKVARTEVQGRRAEKAKKSKRDEAATKIQNAQRCKVARKEVKWRREKKSERDEAATKIQCAQRSKVARKEVKGRRATKVEEQEIITKVQVRSQRPSLGKQQAPSSNAQQLRTLSVGDAPGQ
jgi:hypothetical protein